MTLHRRTLPTFLLLLVIILPVVGVPIFILWMLADQRQVRQMRSAYGVGGLPS